MIITTYTYKENELTNRMKNSFRRFGHEIADWKVPESQNNKLNRLTKRLEGMKRAATGHEKFLYADSGDVICQREIKEEEIPSDKILVAAEKHCWPVAKLKEEYPAQPKTVKTEKGKKVSPWKFLNGGGYCGPVKLWIEFCEKYLMPQYKKDANSNPQYDQHVAFINAVNDGFPIELDYNCEIFQCISHEPKTKKHFNRGEKGELITNLVTGSTPAVIHGNGQTPMDWVEEMAL